MRLQLRVQGDYAREFGQHLLGYSRKWKAYHIVDGNNFIPGEVYQEPDYTDGGAYYTLRIGEKDFQKFKTKRLLFAYLRKLKNENL